jgi:hypothetical protein
LIFNLSRPVATMSDRSAMLSPIAASGGFLVHLDWPTLTPAPVEIAASCSREVTWFRLHGLLLL